MTMFKVLCFFLLDAFLIYTIVAFGDEAGGYLFLILACVAYLTWELIRAIKNLFR